MAAPLRRLLLIHAHPDDESILTGATMAYYAAAGAHVTLLTCTLGEEGEILVPALSQLAADQADQLGGYRICELTAAMKILDVTDHRFLGGTGRFRDSGMMGRPANDHPRAFWRAAKDPAVFEAAVTAAVEVIREIRPQVLITYDENGDYGHPDHIMAHRVAMAAVDAAANREYPGARGEPWQIAKVYWTALPKSALRHGFEVLGDQASEVFEVERFEDVSFGVDDELVTTAIDASRFGNVKMDALAAHATQITVDGPFFALSNKIGREIMGIEFFRLVRGQLAGERDSAGREISLFAGIDK